MRNSVCNITRQNGFHTPCMSMMSKCGYGCYLHVSPNLFSGRLTMPEIAKYSEGAEIYLARLERSSDTYNQISRFYCTYYMRRSLKLWGNAVRLRLLSILDLDHVIKYSIGSRILSDPYPPYSPPFPLKSMTARPRRFLPRTTTCGNAHY